MTHADATLHFVPSPVRCTRRFCISWVFNRETIWLLNLYFSLYNLLKKVFFFINSSFKIILSNHFLSFLLYTIILIFSLTFSFLKIFYNLFQLLMYNFVIIFFIFLFYFSYYSVVKDITYCRADVLQQRILFCQINRLAFYFIS